MTSAIDANFVANQVDSWNLGKGDAHPVALVICGAHDLNTAIINLDLTLSLATIQKTHRIAFSVLDDGALLQRTIQGVSEDVGAINLLFIKAHGQKWNIEFGNPDLTPRFETNDVEPTLFQDLSANAQILLQCCYGREMGKKMAEIANGRRVVAANSIVNSSAHLVRKGGEFDLSQKDASGMELFRSYRHMRFPIWTEAGMELGSSECSTVVEAPLALTQGLEIVEMES